MMSWQLDYGGTRSLSILQIVSLLLLFGFTFGFLIAGIVALQYNHHDPAYTYRDTCIRTVAWNIGSNSSIVVREEQYYCKTRLEEDGKTFVQPISKAEFNNDTSPASGWFAITGILGCAFFVRVYDVFFRDA